MSRLSTPTRTPSSLERLGQPRGVSPRPDSIASRVGLDSRSANQTTRSRFSLSLPPVEGDVILETKPGPSRSLPSGTETILLVDDEPAVRALARQVLQSCGYQVLEAKDGQDALQSAASYESPIHILVTDVAMPNLGGPELAKRLRERIPSLKILFVSGYADDVLLQQGLSEEGISFLHKPYSPFVLASKVRDILANKT